MADRRRQVADGDTVERAIAKFADTYATTSVGRASSPTSAASATRLGRRSAPGASELWRSGLQLLVGALVRDHRERCSRRAYESSAKLRSRMVDRAASAVHRDEDTFASGRGWLRDELGRERQERNDEQQQQVDAHEQGVGSFSRSVIACASHATRRRSCRKLTT